MTHRPLKSTVSSTDILGTSFNATSIILTFQFHFSILSSQTQKKVFKVFYSSLLRGWYQVCKLAGSAVSVRTWVSGEDVPVCIAVYVPVHTSGRGLRVQGVYGVISVCQVPLRD